MKLVNYLKDEHEQLAILIDDMLFDMDALHPELPSSMGMFLNYWNEYFPLAQTIHESIEQGKVSLTQGLPIASAQLISPLPFPASCRRAIVFDVSRGNTKVIPSFHFVNHHNVQGPGEVFCMPDYFSKLDFEPGIAIVISSHCKNIKAAEADQYIAGYMIMNKIIVHDDLFDKNILNVLGPWLVTPDEFAQAISESDEPEANSAEDEMQCRLNGEAVGGLSVSEMQWTFAEIIQTCSYGAGLQPGDVIVTGGKDMGFCLERNLAGKRRDPAFAETWLQNGDVIEVEVARLGVAAFTIAADESDFSLLQ